MGAASYYSFRQFDIQHWIQVSVECDVPTELTPSPRHWNSSYTYLLTGRLGGPQLISVDFERKKYL